MMYLIALGGALGALARFLVRDGLSFRLALAVNLVGSFVMGLALCFCRRGLDRVMFFAMTGSLVPSQPFRHFH